MSCRHGIDSLGTFHSEVCPSEDDATIFEAARVALHGIQGIGGCHR